MLVFGEDVGRKGGVYGVTRGLQQRFGAAARLRHVARRAVDPRLRRSASGVSGLLPVPEIQYLAYLHNAEDQLRGEAASLRFFSARRVHQPDGRARRRASPTRRASAATSTTTTRSAVLRDIPGLVVAVPARPEDAAPMLRACLAAAAVRRAGERASSSRSRSTTSATCTSPATAAGSAPTPPRRRRADRVGPRARRRRRPDDRHVRQRRADEPAGGRAGSPREGIGVPRARPALDRAAAGRRHPARGDARPAGVLVADETRHSGGVGEGVITRAGRDTAIAGRMARVASRDSFVPLGDAANLVLLGEDEIERAARALLAPELRRPRAGTRVGLSGRRAGRTRPSCRRRSRPSRRPSGWRASRR